MFKIGLFCPFFPMFSDNFGEKGGGHYMCLVGEKRVAFRENDSFPIKLMERRRPQQTRTENDYQQLDEGRLNEGTVLIPEKGQNSPIFGSFEALLTTKMAFLIA